MTSPGGRRAPSSGSKSQLDALGRALEQERQTSQELAVQLQSLEDEKTQLKSQIRSLCDKLTSVSGTLKNPADDPTTGERKDNGELSVEQRRPAKLQKDLEDTMTLLESANARLKSVPTTGSAGEIATLRSEIAVLQDELTATAEENVAMQQHVDEMTAEIKNLKESKP